MESNTDYTLDQIPANRRLVDELYAAGKITPEAREYALDILYPADKWGIWISRLLLAIGAALILSGVIYFFAFNWAKITPLIKFTAIQFGIIACLLGAYLRSLDRVSGQVYLLSASVLTGIFMAVFGQVYQTGADAYQLFMMWSLLTLGWTLLSNFAPQWLFWLAITNIFLILWWDQGALPDNDMEYIIFILLAALNGTALGLRDYYHEKGKKTWLQASWLRAVLTSATLVPLLIPVVVFVVEPSTATTSISVAAVIGFFGHGVIYTLYRYRMKDMWSLAATVLSMCIIAEAIGLKILAEVFSNADFFLFLLMGLMTLAVFTAAVIYLRKTIDTFAVEARD